MSQPVLYKLKRWRALEGLSQAEAAQRVDVARRTWHQWEQGASIPDPAHMIRIVTLTQGAVVPNDFYALPSLDVPRREAA